MKRSVAAVVYDKSKKKILLVQRKDVPMWVLPGGGLDEDETAEEAILREIYEEAGVQAAIVRKVAEYTPINKLSYLTFVFECSYVDGQLSLSDETQNVGFFELNDLPADFFHIHQEWLNDALKNEVNVIHRPLSSVTYWNLLKYFCKHPWRVLKFSTTRMFKS